ncbi:endonuclease/exonuclease/phosphatase family protein [Echinicola salinicaeni]|uniref:endonuclease/exonuclease/phosphatase family protein n=1 Tax=Echinicola salinicaeni TaxID=2762757 RepID=UPI001E470F15|nr:endonuclease/exonuclease/phosphatase family protein [Echinicola salinicaeni]
MKLIYIILSIWLGLISCKEGEQPTPEMEKPKSTKEITVLSYNIHHSNPPSKPDLIDLEAVAKVIKESNADIVGLQEVDVYTERSGSDLHMAEKLGELAGYDYYYFSKGIDYKEGEYGTAILSKYPLSNEKTIKLPKEEGTEQRTLSLVTVSLTEESKIYFGNTHMDFTSESNGLAQAKFITKYFDESTDNEIPAIVVGDFNAVPSSPAILHFDRYFERTCKSGCANTASTNNPRKIIDYIIYKNTKDFEVESHEVINETYASDHFPVLAKLILKEF